MDTVSSFFPGSKVKHYALFWICLFVGVFGVFDELYAVTTSNYEVTLNQRRRNDQIDVEIFIRSLNSSAPKLGDASFVISCSPTYLTPAASQVPAVSDSISYDADQASPVVTLTSSFSNANGYNVMGAQAYGDATDGLYSVEVRLTNLSTGGYLPDTAGRGSFVGKMTFDMANTSSIDYTTLTSVKWNTLTSMGDVRIFDVDGNDIESTVTFTNPADFTIVGITILNPNGPSEVVARSKTYASVGATGAAGYPIYFERSGLNLPAIATPSTNATAYIFEYSLNSGSSWTEFGRVAETASTSASLAAAGTLAFHVSGEISTVANYSVATTASPILTSTGGTLSTTQGNPDSRIPLRVVWATNTSFLGRSDYGRIRITQLSLTNVKANITSRNKLTPFDISNNDFVIGRIFFLQFDGATQYVRTANKFSNPTQITVETWINLNEYKATGSEVGIIASGAGSNITSTEGPWILYLKDGKYPAFRARDILDRGTGGYLGNLVSIDSLDVISSVGTLGDAHRSNWVHLAATVNNDTLALYVNGEIVARTTNSAAQNMRMATVSYPVWIGVNPNNLSSSGSFLNAGLKGTRVWRTALTQTELRQRVAGISSPATTSGTYNVLKALELYYSFDGTRSDLASETYYQNGADNAQFYVNGVVANSSAHFRGDLPHLRLTSPIGGEGVSNLQAGRFDIRWFGYGFATGLSTTANVDLQFSLDNGVTWTYAKNASSVNLGGATGANISVTTATATWAPYYNDGINIDDATAAANLQSFGGYSTTAIFRIRGRQGIDTSTVYTGQSFTIAPYFALQRTANAVIYTDDGGSNSAFNISGSAVYMESWIRPYHFPDAVTEKYFPIFDKVDSASGAIHYSFRLLSTGQIQFITTDINGNVRTATSDATLPLIAPNSKSLDSAWSHVAVYVNLGNGGTTDVRFYIDGTAQSTNSTLTNQLGTNLVVKANNAYPTFIGYEPALGTTGTSHGFVGEMREVRFWSGAPNGSSVSGSEPNAMTLFIQGAQAVHASTLTSNFNGKLVSVFSFDCSAAQTGSFINNGFNRSLNAYYSSTLIVGRYYGSAPRYVAVQPKIKLVEPIYNQKVAATKTDLRIRWVGFNFTGVTTGDAIIPSAPSVEFSIHGGGGNSMQPYQYVASNYWSAIAGVTTGNESQALNFASLTTSTYQFTGTGTPIQFAGTLNVAITNPDYDRTETYTTGSVGPLSASLTNARLRLTATTATYVTSVQSESPLFTVTPASNFVTRVVLEGYHTGTSATSLVNMPTSYAGGGLKISLYKDNAGAPGSFVATSESADGYSSTSYSDRNAGNYNYANVPFTFENLQDGNYWVVVEHLNHLPVMSRFAAPFAFGGNASSTWTLASGWDFQTWNGTALNVVPASTTAPSTFLGSGYYTAYGNSVTSATAGGYSNTALIYSDGQSGVASTNNSQAAMVAGDVVHDGQINAADRVQVRQDNGTNLVRSDVTGDGTVNATDRTIVDRNFGKTSSISGVTFPKANGKNDGQALNAKMPDPFTVISPLDPAMSEYLNKAALDAVQNAGKANETEVMLKNSNGMLGSSIQYIVTAEPVKNGNYIDVPLYIKNVGTPFALANATFGVSYNSSALQYVSLLQESTVIFSNVPAKGYAQSTSGPLLGSDKPIADLRTIEIDYDAYANKGGVVVPNTKTYLGTLHFTIKDAREPITFDWHFSTAVLATNGSTVTPKGDFQAIKPLLLYTAAIVSPNGGERLRANKSYPVKWSNGSSSLGKAKSVNIEFSADMGKTWQAVTTSPVTDVTVLSTNWQFPNISSDQCLVRIVDILSGYELGRSSGIFSVAPAAASISKPAYSDATYTGGNSGLVKWSSTGLDSVRFEFAADGYTNWVSVSAKRNAADGSLSWSIPRVNTKHAVVRMLEVSSGDEIARSSEFKVLAGSIALINPVAKEVFVAGDTKRVRWTFDNVTVFDMEFSADNGQTWTGMQQDLDASKRYVDWLVPNQNTDQAMVRAIYTRDAELVYTVSPVFKITGAVSGVGEETVDGFAFAQPTPNPFGKETVLNFTLPSDENVTVSVYNTMGQEVAMPINEAHYSAGKYAVRFTADNLPAGVYYFRLNAGTFSATRQVVVVK